MESILQGWLTKSPPEKKQFKLFGSKWRKRYFVLYAPPTVDGIPDAYTALLEYYSTKKLNHKCGTINLAACEEVLSSLDSEIYKHVFGLRTMHKGQIRTYYLAAETETEMNKWVNKLCHVLGLTENDDNVGSPPSQFPHRMQQNVRTTMPVKIPGSTKQPFSRPLTHQCPLGTAGIQSPAPPPPRSIPTTPFTRLNLSESNLLDVASPKGGSETRRETVDVSWQMASPPGVSRMMSPTGSSLIRNAESFPELDRFSPTTRKPGSAPDERRELPPIPPEKTGPKVITEPEVDIDYDMPKQKYYERYNSEDRKENNNDFYNLSQDKGYKSKGDENGFGWYNKPQNLQSPDVSYNRSINLNTGDHDDCYNIPKSQLDKRKHASQGEEFYNIPKSEGQPWPDFDHLPQKKSDRRSYGGQWSGGHQGLFGGFDQMEDYDVPKSKLSDQDREDDYNVPKTKMPHYFPEEDYDMPKLKNLSEPKGDDDVYTFPKHQELLEDNSISYGLKCLWERSTIQGEGFNGKQPPGDQGQGFPTQPFHPSYQSRMSGNIPASLSVIPPEKPPRPFSRPSPDRQTVGGVPVNVEAEQPVSTSQHDFKHPDLPAEEVDPPEDRGISENLGSSELKKTPSTTFKQYKSTVQSSSSIHKRQVAQNLPIHDSIRFTQRTKSFKRSIPSQDRSTLPLPVKRIVERSESSSSASSDDEGGNHSGATQGN